MRHKPLQQQVLVITGASSGIGLATARLAAQRGARLVLAARNDEALQSICREIQAKGGQAIYVVADVGAQEDVRRVTLAAMEHFGGFDTWINNAGVSTYGRLEDVPLADQRRLFDTTYWGVVHGSLEAAPHLKAHGGTLINVGSILGERAVPLQGPYSAAKHAVKGFTDALRMELAHEQAPVSVTLIKPSSIDTPYRDHAKNFLGQQPTNPPPVYAAELVAGAILHAAEHPVRELVVGGAGRAFIVLGHVAPHLADRLSVRALPPLQRREEPPEPRSHNSLYDPGEDGEVHAGYAHVHRHSTYTSAVMHPRTSAAAALGLGLLAAGWWLGRRQTPTAGARRRAA